MVDNWNIQKVTEPNFPGKFIFTHIWTIRAQNGPKIKFFCICLKILFFVFCGINLKRKQILLLKFHHQSHIWQSISSWVMSKMLLANQIASFFKMYYFKKEVNAEVYFWHADKYWSFLQVDTIILGVHSEACPKYLK